MTIRKVCVLGAPADQGQPLVAELLAHGFDVTAGVRRPNAMADTPFPELRTVFADITDADAMAQELKALCNSQGGAGKIPPTIKSTLSTVANILNINWVARSLEKPAQLICSRGNHCPRDPACYQRCGG